MDLKILCRALFIAVFLLLPLYMMPQKYTACHSRAAEINAPAGAAQENAVGNTFIAIGAVRSAAGRGASENKPTYELIDESNEVYKLIGPKSILDQIISVKNFTGLKFKITGRLMKKDKKKGILMSGYEIYEVQPAKTPPLDAPASAATDENSIK